MSETVASVRSEMDELRAAIAEEAARQATQTQEATEAGKLIRLQHERDALREQLATMRSQGATELELAADVDRVSDTRVQDPATGVFLDVNLVSGEISVEDLKVNELREQARAAGLPVSGTKTELVQRLEDAGHGTILVTNDPAAAAENKE